MTRISRMLVGAAVGRVPRASDLVISGPPGLKFILEPEEEEPPGLPPKFGRRGRLLVAIAGLVARVQSGPVKKLRCFLPFLVILRTK